MNNGWDEFSIPKEVARALIAGDKRAGHLFRDAEFVPAVVHLFPELRVFQIRFAVR